MRIALVHDYLADYGGAERVLEAFHEIWPQAPTFTAWVDWQWLKQKKPEWLNWQIIPSWFDKVPFKKQLCSPLRFLTPKIWSSFDLSTFDVVLISSAWYMPKGVSLAKSKKNSQPTTHHSQPLYICYCHTPPRYLYGYATALEFQRFWWGRLYATIINPFMRYYDYKSSETTDWFICNSREVQRRIEKFYRREAEIIYPPVSVEVPKVSKVSKVLKESYYLMVNRLVQPKNIDLAIRACNKLGQKLIIVGTGRDETRLKKIAGDSPYIQFLGYIDDQKLAELYSGCLAVLYLAKDEDFGITPVEAMSFGKPVIALRSGGVVETIIEGKTGEFIDKPDIEELIRCLKSFKVQRFKLEDCLKQAKKFSKERFKTEIKAFIAEKYQKWENKKI